MLIIIRPPQSHKLYQPSKHPFLDAFVCRSSSKWMFLKISQILQENTFVESLLIKLYASFFTEHLRWLLLFFTEQLSLTAFVPPKFCSCDSYKTCHKGMVYFTTSAKFSSSLKYKQWISKFSCWKYMWYVFYYKLHKNLSLFPSKAHVLKQDLLFTY